MAWCTPVLEHRRVLAVQIDLATAAEGSVLGHLRIDKDQERLIL
jgi:hypothetical protein